MDDITAAGDVAAIVLTVGWHERQAHLFAQRTGARVFVPAEDTCMLETLEVFETYGDGMELPLGLRAVGVPGLTRGEQALLAPCQGGTLLVGNALGTTASGLLMTCLLVDIPPGIPNRG